MKCWIETGALAFIKIESQRVAPKETGGLLLGYWAAEGVIITMVTGPGPKSKHRLSSYLPDNKFDSDQIAEIYTKTNGVTTYLGDWHSHPKGGSGLSKDDIITLFNISNFEPSRAKTPIMLIAAKESYDWTPAVWKMEIVHVGKEECYSQLSQAQILDFSY